MTDQPPIEELVRYLARVRAVIKGGKLTPDKTALLLAKLRELRAQLVVELAPDQAAAVRELLGDLASKEGRA